LNLLGKPRNPLQISGTKQESGSLRVAAANRFLQSRGDWTPLELFIAGVRAWDVEMRRRLAQESNACQP
jgi:hypothetical protein